MGREQKSKNKKIITGVIVIVLIVLAIITKNDDIINYIEKNGYLIKNKLLKRVDYLEIVNGKLIYSLKKQMAYTDDF